MCIETIKVGKIGYELVKIPGGSFTMGSPGDEEGRIDYEGPQRLVEIPDFYMGKYPVTNEQYAQFFEENPNTERPIFWERNSSGPAIQNKPVAGVYLQEALWFAEWTGCARLPSESEWEYACRAGSTSRFYSGDSEEDLDRIGWYSGNSYEVTQPVGLKAPNEFGLHDMSGNVFEWVRDPFHDSYYDAPNDSRVWRPNFTIFGVIRGGSVDADSRFCRSAFRDKYRPDIVTMHVGFRLALSMSCRL